MREGNKVKDEWKVHIIWEKIKIQKEEEFFQRKEEFLPYSLN